MQLVLIDNMTLDTYPVRNGSTFLVDIIEIMEKREFIEPLSRIEEELFDEDFFSDSGHSSR